MFTAALISALQMMAVPGISLLIGGLTSKYFDYTERPGLAAMVSCSTVALIGIFWLLPMLNHLTSMAVGLGSVGSSAGGSVAHFFDGNSLLSAGSSSNLNCDWSGIQSEVTKWGANALNQGQDIVNSLPQSPIDFHWAHPIGELIIEGGKALGHAFVDVVTR